MSDLDGIKNVAPLRRELDDVLQHNGLINQERERHEILKIICSWDPVQMRSEGDPQDNMREQTTRPDQSQ